MNTKETKQALLHQIKLNLERNNCTSMGINPGLITFKGKDVIAIFSPKPDEIYLGIQTWVKNTMKTTHGNEKTLSVRFLNQILNTLLTTKCEPLDNAIEMLLNTDNRKYVDDNNYLSFENVGSIELSPSDEKVFGFRHIDGIEILKENGVEQLTPLVASDDSIFSIPLNKVSNTIYPQIIEKIRETIKFQKSLV